MEAYFCKDCRFYLPVDVARGICKLSKNDIGPDDFFCDHAEKMPKCRFCRKFTPEKDHLGRCMNTILAYPDMNASNCVDFEWYNQN